MAEKVDLAGYTFLALSQRTKLNLIAFTIDKWKHAAASKEHCDRLALFEPFAHLDQNEIIETVGQRNLNCLQWNPLREKNDYLEGPKMASWLVHAAASSGRHSRWNTGATVSTSESILTIISWNFSSW